MENPKILKEMAHIKNYQMSQNLFTVFKNIFPTLLCKKFGKHLNDDDQDFFIAIVKKSISKMTEIPEKPGYRNRFIYSIIDKIIRVCSDMDIEIDDEELTEFFYKIMDDVGCLELEAKNKDIKYNHILETKIFKTDYEVFFRCVGFLSLKVAQHKYNSENNCNINICFEPIICDMNIDDSNYRVITNSMEIMDEFKKEKPSSDFSFVKESDKFVDILNDAIGVYKKLYRNE